MKVTRLVLANSMLAFLLIGCAATGQQNSELEAAVQNAQATADEAKAIAMRAEQKADQALATANGAQSTADQALNEAREAKSLARDAAAQSERMYDKAMTK